MSEGPCRAFVSVRFRNAGATGRAWSEPLEPRLLLATLPAGFSETQITGLSSPTAMEFAPDGRLFVAQQNGVMRIIKNGALVSGQFFDLDVNSTGERGLLGIAFDPNFNTNKFIYVYYTTNTAPIHNRVSRFTANGDVAVPGSEVVLLDLENLSATNHNGGAMHFGPDGKLYIAVGENAVGSNSQNKGNLLGKMLRMNPNGSVPGDNPFFNDPTFVGRNKLIYNMGLRNPYTFSIQPGTGRIFINDVGQNTWEEINEGIPGANFGWPGIEGPRTTQTPPANYRDPLFAYNQTASPSFPANSGTGAHPGGCAITGGTFYNPLVQAFPLSHMGDYFYADYCTGFINKLDLTGAVPTWTSFATSLSNPVDLKVGPDGSLWYLQRGTTDLVARIVNNQAGRPTISDQPDNVIVREGESAHFMVIAGGTGPLTYQWLKNGFPIPGATASMYNTPPTTPGDHQAIYQVVVSNANGGTFSATAALTVNEAVPPVLQDTFFSTAPTAAIHLGYRFNESVSSSWGTSDLVLRNLTTNTTVPTSAYTSSFDASTNTGRFFFNTGLADGVYEARLVKAGVTDAAGNALTDDAYFYFLYVTGTSGESLYVRRSGGNIEGYLNTTPGVGVTPDYLLPVATGLDHLAFVAGSGPQTFTFDLRGGPIPSDVIEFRGSANDDVLHVVGTPGNDSVQTAPSQTTVNGAVIQHGSGFAPRFGYDGQGGTDTFQFGSPRTILTDLGAGGTTANVSLLNSAIVTFMESQRFNSLNLSAGTRASLQPGGSRVLRTNLLSVGADAQVDLWDNALIVHSTAGTRDADWAEALSLLRTGLHNGPGFWRGPGINSSAAAGENTPLHGLSAILNDYVTVGLPPGPIKQTFAGVPVGANDILIRYTYFGDADADGDVDGQDYFLIDDAFSEGATSGGPIRGDFDFNGVVNGTDYFLIDNSFSSQPAPSPAMSPLFSMQRIEEPDDDPAAHPLAPPVF